MKPFYFVVVVAFNVVQNYAVEMYYASPFAKKNHIFLEVFSNVFVIRELNDEKNLLFFQKNCSTFLKFTIFKENSYLFLFLNTQIGERKMKNFPKKLPNPFNKRFLPINQ